VSRIEEEEKKENEKEKEISSRYRRTEIFAGIVYSDSYLTTATVSEWQSAKAVLLGLGCFLSF